VIKHLAAFAIMFAYDFVWARYTLAMAERRPISASLTASMMPVFTAIMAIAYVSDWKTMFSAAAGAFLGTYVSLKMEKRPEQKQVADLKEALR
jgi:hypothetical protein